MQCDGVSLLDDKGSISNRNHGYEVSPAKTASAHQDSLSSSSDLDDDILPLFRRIQLQPRKSDLSSDGTGTQKTTNKKLTPHIHGTVDFPIVLD